MKPLANSACVLLWVMNVLLVSAADAQDAPETNATISENPANAEPQGDAKADSGFLSIEKLHKVIQAERKEALLEIDKERKATLVYLTGERKAVMEELRQESRRITDLLQSERKATVIEVEAAGDRIVENALQESRRLVDHFFIRLLQLTAIAAALVCIVGIIGYKVGIQKARQQDSRRDDAATGKATHDTGP